VVVVVAALAVAVVTLAVTVVVVVTVSEVVVVTVVDSVVVAEIKHIIKSIPPSFLYLYIIPYTASFQLIILQL
jgi:hypothetical protein